MANFNISYSILSIMQLCHINNQWAQDYESLTQKMTAYSTGCTSTASHQHISKCPQLGNESQNKFWQVVAKLEMQQQTINQLNQQVEHLENAIQFQVYRLV